MNRSSGQQTIWIGIIGMANLLDVPVNVFQVEIGEKSFNITNEATQHQLDIAYNVLPINRTRLTNVTSKFFTVKTIRTREVIQATENSRWVISIGSILFVIFHWPPHVMTLMKLHPFGFCDSVRWNLNIFGEDVTLDLTKWYLVP